MPLGPSYLTFSVLLLSSLALREGKAPTHRLSLRKGTALIPLISFYVCFFLCFQLWSLLINLKPPLQRFFLFDSRILNCVKDNSLSVQGEKLILIVNNLLVM